LKSRGKGEKTCQAEDGNKFRGMKNNCQITQGDFETGSVFSIYTGMEVTFDRWYRNTQKNG